MGWERMVSPLLCLVLGRSKVLWLHSCFSFLYFVINFVFMTHHCLGFVPKKSHKVSKRNGLPELLPASQSPPQLDRPTASLQRHPTQARSAHL